MLAALIGSFTRFLIAFFNDFITEYLVSIGIEPGIAGTQAHDIVQGGVAAFVIAWSVRAHLKSQNKIKALTSENVALHGQNQALKEEEIKWKNPPAKTETERKYND